MNKKDCQNQLNNLREKINNIDEEILKLLNERAKVAKDVGDIKKECNLPVFNPGRETEIFKRLKEKNKEFGEIFPTEAIRYVYKEIISACRSLEEDIKVAYLGPQATFTHQAAIKKFGQSVKFIPTQTIKDVFDEIVKGTAQYGVVPIENTIEGAVNYTLDLLVDYSLLINGEIILEINLHLLSKNDKKENIKRIYTHSHALAETRDWLLKHMPNVPIIEVDSTAKAAELAKDDYEAGAIASEVAAEYYGLNILERKIDKYKHNKTRFLIIGKELPPKGKKNKTSFVFSVKNEVGALYKSLEILYKHNINMTKIESRPSKREAWEYIFFTDIEGHIDEKNVKEALEELRKKSPYFKILGSYPKYED